MNTETTWGTVIDANDGAGIHGAQVADYIADKMGATAADLTWTVEEFRVSEGMADPNSIRNQARIETAQRLYTEGTAPAIIVIETPNGRRIHVDGWHRLGAAETLGLASVPAYVGRRNA